MPVQPNHHVQAGSAVDPVAGEAFDGRHGAADDVVAFDDLDAQAGLGEVAGGDEAVVPGPDHHRVQRIRHCFSRLASTA